MKEQIDALVDRFLHITSKMVLDECVRDIAASDEAGDKFVDLQIHSRNIKDMAIYRTN